MSRAKVIVKRLNAIQNFGAMNVLCTDKTGTLTQDRIILKPTSGEESDGFTPAFPDWEPPRCRRAEHVECF